MTSSPVDLVPEDAHALCCLVADQFAAGIEVRQYRGVMRLVLPLVDSLGDFVEVAVSSPGGEGGCLVLSDMGRSWLDVSTLTGPVKSGSQKERLFHQAAAVHGVEVVDGRLEIECDRGTAGSATLAIAEAIKDTHQLVHLGKQTISRLFKEEVGLFLKDHNVAVERDYEVRGRSPVAHHVDFAKLNGVPKYVQAVASEDKLKASLLAWYDIEGTHEFAFAAVLDDEEDYRNRTFQHFAFRVPHVFVWSQRERLAAFLQETAS